MKQFLSRYSHWLFLSIVGISLFSSLFTIKDSTLDVIAFIFGGIGLLSLGLVTYIVEKNYKNHKDGD